MSEKGRGERDCFFFRGVSLVFFTHAHFPPFSPLSNSTALHHAPSVPQLLYAAPTAGAGAAGLLLSGPAAATAPPPPLRGLPSLPPWANGPADTRNTSLESATSGVDVRAALRAAHGLPPAPSPTTPATAAAAAPADPAALAARLAVLESWIASVEAAERTLAAQAATFDAALAAVAADGAELPTLADTGLGGEGGRL